MPKVKSAKASTSVPPTPLIQKPVKSAPKLSSEIDDIFAGKGKPSVVPNPTPVIASDESVDSEKRSKKKRKQKKSALASADPTSSAATTSTHVSPSTTLASTSPDSQPKPSKPSKTRTPETVHDPSAKLSSASSSARQTKSNPKQKGGVPEKDNDDMERFMDSRGTGPRRKTEEGYLIYKEDELGIQEEGGDTPLCPFDCDCCY